MNTLYQKVNFNLNSFISNNIREKNCVTFYGAFQKLDGTGSAYYPLTAAYHQLLIDKLPEAFRTNVRPFYVITTGNLAPHIDREASCVLNYYHNPGDCETVWYKFKDQSVKELITRTWSKDDLVEVSRFIARSQDCYILNSKEVHSVEYADAPRHFISYVWKGPTYSDIRDAFLIEHTK